MFQKGCAGDAPANPFWNTRLTFAAVDSSG